MNDSRYRWILYVIVLVIIATISIQVYWNYKNYLVNKQQLLNDVQVSLDKAVDDYYALLAERTTLGLSLTGDSQKDVLEKGGILEQLTKQIDESKKEISYFNINYDSIEGVTVYRGLEVDSMMKRDNEANKPISLDSVSTKVKTLKKNNDSLHYSNIELLTSKVVISITNDTLDIKEVDSLLKLELSRKNIAVTYNLQYIDDTDRIKSNDTVFYSFEEGITPNNSSLSTVSKSTFLPEQSKLSIAFSNETKVVLKRILGGILISTLLVLTVISSLFYLLKIIKHQKQLAEVKNDLISNITHEFKTPIATIGVALESIKDFNVIDDKEKTKKYLKLSNNQLSKLNIMVEKLLETATLDSDSLNLNKEEINIVDVLSILIEKHKLQSSKSIKIKTTREILVASVDPFHFENAINNIIDNAIKYGGDIITININENENAILIDVSDTGNALNNVHKDKIFEKFYRVTKGNTHDVKGFGIGLYYTKKIIEKHSGTIHLNLDTSNTTFKISIPK